MRGPILRCGALWLAAIAALTCVPAAAQEQGQQQDAQPREPYRYRIALGGQLVPKFPGADDFSFRPLFDPSRARGDTPFTFEAPDESFDLAFVNTRGLSLGPALSFEGKRSSSDVGGHLPRVGFTVEVGGFAQYQITDNFRVRGELRKGLGGHEGLIGNASADLVLRDGDEWLFAIGPRLTWADGDYHDAFFSVAPEDAAPSGLPAFRADGGIEAVGAVASLLTQLTRRWGIYSYLKYDRLTGDAADSPIVRRFGSRDQVSGGAALTYTFGRGVE